MHKSHRLKGLAGVAAFALVLGFAASVQSAIGQEVTASVLGKVTDPSGAPVANAKVTATDKSRGTVWPTVTNTSGDYNLPRLPVGTYDVKVESTGFQAAVRSDILLVLNQAARLDFELEIGSITQTVEVNAAPPLLQTDSTQLGTIIDARTNTTLPLATRNYVQLTLLAPGSVATNPGSFTGSQASFGSGRPYINGNRNETDYFLLDGMDNNQVSENQVAYSPQPDAIEEFNMITQNASAEFGQFMGGIVSVSIKSGTNQVHGDVFEFIRNDALNANVWQNNWRGLARPLLRWNEFGGTVGGPIVKNKLFIFGDYQGSRYDQPATSSAYSVFTPAERTGDFSQVLTQQGIQLHYPGTKTPIPGNVIPQNLLSPQALAIMKSPLYPQPVNGALINNGTNTTHGYTNQDQGDIRVDYAATDSDHIYGRYSQAHIIQPSTNSIPMLYNSENLLPSYNGVLDYTKTITPNLVNDIRAGVNYTPIITGQLTGTAFSAGSVGIPGVPTSVLPAFTFSGGYASGFGNAEVMEEFADTVIQAEDTLLWTVGKHTMHIGFQYFRDRMNTFYSGNAGIAGQFNFNGQYSGLPEADFMMGQPYQIQGGIAGGTWGQRSSVTSAFFQDDWRVSPTLTLNLGLRFEYNSPWTEVKNRQANFGLVNGQQYNAGSNCPYANCEALYNPYLGIDDFQPRLGIAWTPTKNTVIRTAYTMSSFLEGTGTNLRLTLNPPFATEHLILYNPTQTPSTLAQGYLPFESNPGNPFVGAGLRLWDPNIRPAVSQQWNFTIQHQFGNDLTLQAGYVGQRNTHLMVPIWVSQGILNANGTVSPSNFLSGNPTLQNEIGNARLTQSSANQDYDALQVSLQKQLSKGLEYQLNYTYSKCMTNSIGYYGDGGQASTNDYYWPNAYDARSQWGPCYYDVTHTVSGYVSYDLPFGRGRSFGSNMGKAADAVVGGWQVNAIPTFRGGFPYTINNYRDSSQTHAPEPRANCIAPGNVFGTMDSPNGGYQWFNPNSYAGPALGTFGNCGVGTIRGPGMYTVDVSLTKSFSITERQSIEFRAEAINLTNTVVLGSPGIGLPGAVVANGNIGVGSFGQIFGAQDARQLQFALKYHF